MSNVQEISSEVIDKVRCALEAFASAKMTPAFSDIEAAVSVKFRQDQWHQVLDPIYEELRAAGEPDLTTIIVYGSGEKKGYPAYFSDGSKARSRYFNPNNLTQLSRWTEEVKRVFTKYSKP
jgi:hypothetical protein